MIFSRYVSSTHMMDFCLFMDWNTDTHCICGYQHWWLPCSVFSSTKTKTKTSSTKIN